MRTKFSVHCRVHREPQGTVKNQIVFIPGAFPSRNILAMFAVRSTPIAAKVSLPLYVFVLFMAIWVRASGLTPSLPLTLERHTSTICCYVLQQLNAGSV